MVVHTIACNHILTGGDHNCLKQIILGHGATCALSLGMIASAHALVVECQELRLLLGDWYAPKHPAVMPVLRKDAVINR